MHQSTLHHDLARALYARLPEKGPRMSRRQHHSEHSRGGRHRGHRQRAKRGALRIAVLTLLDEKPMHGYELMSELEERSGGRWRPSPGSVYPALVKLESAGLLSSNEDEGKRAYSLTDRGREVLTELRAEQPDGAPQPWDDPTSGRRDELRRHVSELVGQTKQIGRFGSPEQIEEAKAILGDAVRRLYVVLATAPHDDGASAPADEADAGEADVDT